jgi:hypothetical protein
VLPLKRPQHIGKCPAHRVSLLLGQARIACRIEPVEQRVELQMKLLPTFAIDRREILKRGIHCEARFRKGTVPPNARRLFLS